MDSVRFTEDELAIAKSVDLVAVASYLGYTPKRIGKYYTLKEMDSIRIYNHSHWYRWSRQYDKGNNGGSQIDFLRVFAGLEIKDAVFWLLDFAGYRRISETDRNLSLKHQVKTEPEVQKKFILPAPSSNNSYLYSYLCKERGIRREVVDYFVNQNLIYESNDYHNVVFKGNDANGITRFASMRGVFDKHGKAFKCDVAGNDKNYGFNVRNTDSNEIVVFEAAIDLISYVDIFSDFETNKLALGMTYDAPLETFIKENPNITHIRFCLDNDEPGRRATKELMEKYKNRGYEVEDCHPPDGVKDINEWLVKSKQLSKLVSTKRDLQCDRYQK